MFPSKLYQNIFESSSIDPTFIQQRSKQNRMGNAQKKAAREKYERRRQASFDLREKAAREKATRLRVVTSVTHVSGWDPQEGKALLCIGTLEYSKMTAKDQNDLYLMKTVETTPRGSVSAELHDEFMVTFIDKDMTEENAKTAYEKISIQKRVIKHVSAGEKMLETRMNGDVARNFRIKGGLCEHDGLHVIVPSKEEVTKKESFDRDGKSLTIKKLFQKMRQHGCDYLVIIGREAATKFAPVVASLRQETSRNMMAPAAATEGETKSGSRGSSNSICLESVSKWTPPIHGGKVLIAYAHSSLGNDAAAKKGYTMKDGEFMVSYTSPLSVSTTLEDDNAIDEMIKTKKTLLRVNSAFIGRINGHWTPNYSLSINTNDVEKANEKGYKGLWVLNPESRSMEQVECWKKLHPGGHKTTVKDLLSRMKKEFDCDYLVVLGCKYSYGKDNKKATRQEMLRVVLMMEGYLSDKTVQEWGMDSIKGLTEDCKMEEEEWTEESKRVIDAVLKGMMMVEHGEESAGVAEKGCGVLRWLANGNADNKKRIGEAGGIDMILSMMEVHGAANAEVASRGCGALWSLAFNNDYKRKILAANGVSMVECMKSTWASNSGVQKNAKGALCKLMEIRLFGSNTDDKSKNKSNFLLNSEVKNDDKETNTLGTWAQVVCNNTTTKTTAKLKTTPR